MLSDFPWSVNCLLICPGQITKITYEIECDDRLDNRFIEQNKKGPINMQFLKLSKETESLICFLLVLLFMYPSLI